MKLLGSGSKNDLKKVHLLFNLIKQDTESLAVIEEVYAKCIHLSQGMPSCSLNQYVIISRFYKKSMKGQMLGNYDKHSKMKVSNRIFLFVS